MLWQTKQGDPVTQNMQDERSIMKGSSLLRNKGVDGAFTSDVTARKAFFALDKGLLPSPMPTPFPFFFFTC